MKFFTVDGYVSMPLRLLSHGVFSAMASQIALPHSHCIVLCFTTWQPLKLY